MRCFRVLLCLLLTGCFCAVAQISEGPTKKEPKSPAARGDKAKQGGDEAMRAKRAAVRGGKAKSAESETAAETKPAALPIDLKGDEITLKSGAVLKGVQVLRRTPVEVEVQVSPGVTLSIPCKQITFPIKLDNIEPLQGVRPGVAAPEQKEGNLIPGNKLKPEVSEKLTSPLPEPSIKYENADLIAVLAELSQRFGVTIVVDDPVKGLPVEQRRWAFEAKPGMNLMGLLQDELLKKFKNLAVVYQYDKLLVTTKERANEMAFQETSQAPVPPSATEAPPMNAPAPPPAVPPAPTPPALPPPAETPAALPAPLPPAAPAP
jgi:hypothetical protein